MALLDQINGAIARRPAVPAAALFILGIATCSATPYCPPFWLTLLAGLLALAVALRRLSGACSLLAALGIFAGGICAGQLAVFGYAPNDIGVFASPDPHLAWVRGRIEQPPRVTASETGGRPLPDKQDFDLTATEVKSTTGWIKATGELAVTISPPMHGLSAGQSVALLGQLSRPPPAMNPGGFDWAEHDRRERVLATMYVSRPFDVQVVAPASRFSFPLPAIRATFHRLLSDGFTTAQSADHAVLLALVFGERDAAIRSTQDDFTRAGAIHLLAANGTRIAILAAAIYLLCRLLQFPPRPALVILTLSVCLFGFLTMPAPQALRPIIVCAVVGAGLIGRRAIDPLNLLALVAIVLLVARPIDLFGPGFQLSLAIVLGLLLFTRPVTKWLEGPEDPDRKVAELFAPPPASVRAGRHLKHRAIQAAAAATVAWVVAAPLVAYHFEQFNPWTAPVGLLLAPLAAAALAGGFAKIALTAICPPLAHTWAAAATIPPIALRHAVHALAALPLSDLPITRPAVWTIELYYAMLILPLIPWPKRSPRWCARCASAGACAVLMVLPLGGRITPPGSSRLRVTLLSVGAGQCAVIEPAGGDAILIDAGSTTIADPLRTCLEPFLRHEQRRRVRFVFLSHGDYDHISAVRQVVPEYGVNQVLTSPFFRRHANESPACASLLNYLDASGHSPRLLVAGDSIDVGPGAKIEVLWPPPACAMNSNNAGLVLRLTWAGRSILFPADIQEPAELELLKHPQRLRSDILVAPHHGSSETTTRRFINAVNPQVILASSSGRLTMKQRTFDADAAGTPLYRTSRRGAVTVQVQADGELEVSPFLPGVSLDFPPPAGHHKWNGK